MSSCHEVNAQMMWHFIRFSQIWLVGCNKRKVAPITALLSTVLHSIASNAEDTQQLVPVFRHISHGIFLQGSELPCAEDTHAASQVVCTFHGHEDDVNIVRSFVDRNIFGTGSDGGTCRLFDIRANHQLQVCHQQRGDNEVSHVFPNALSMSDRFLFVEYSNGDCHVWDGLWASMVS